MSPVPRPYFIIPRRLPSPPPTPPRTMAGPVVVDVSHLRPPATLGEHERADLLSRASKTGLCVCGNAVAVTGFADVWCTAFVRLRGVPDQVAGTVTEFSVYVGALYAMLSAKYGDLDLPMPSWRSWTWLRTRRWPFLPEWPPPPLPRRRVKTKVIVVRPLL